MANLSDFYKPQTTGNPLSEFDCLVDGTGSGDYTTINAAWDAGHRRIKLAAGTYTLTGHCPVTALSEDVRLVGSGKGITTIDTAGYDLPALTGLNSDPYNVGVAAQDNVGTITVTLGSKNVVGIGTDFTQLVPGNTTLNPSGGPNIYHLVDEIIDATNMTLMTPVLFSTSGTAPAYLCMPPTITVEELTWTTSVTPTSYESMFYSGYGSSDVSHLASGNTITAKNCSIILPTAIEGFDTYFNYDGTHVSDHVDLYMENCTTTPNIWEMYGTLVVENSTCGFIPDTYDNAQSVIKNSTLNGTIASYVFGSHNTSNYTGYAATLEKCWFPNETLENIVDRGAIILRDCIVDGQTVNYASYGGFNYNADGSVHDGYTRYNAANGSLQPNTKTIIDNSGAVTINTPTSADLLNVIQYQYIEVIKLGTGTLTMDTNSQGTIETAGSVAISTPGVFRWYRDGSDWVKVLG